MADLQPHLQETRTNCGAPQDPVASNETAAAAAADHVTSKRQRRPSVRLGEIGDQPAATVSFESHRRAKQSKVAVSKDKSSKTRNLTHVGAGGGEALEADDGEINLDNLAVGSWRTKNSKPYRRVKRPRTNWFPKIDGRGSSNINNDDGGILNGDRDEKYGGGEGDWEAGFSRDFEVEDSESPSEGHSPVDDSLEILEDGDERGHGNERELQFGRPHSLSGCRAVEGSRDQHVNHHHDERVDFDGPADTYRNDGHGGRRGRGGGRWSREGVKIWLNDLGLGRYWPVFEVHEVDDEVLPLLTLEDLKDMGISAIGSRRKMFSAIEKLNKGFS